MKIWTPTAMNRWPEVITTLLFLYPLITQWRFFKHQAMLIFWALAIAAPFIFFGINYLIDAETAVKYADFEQLPRIYLFIPIAWWLGGNRRTIGLFLAMALGGFFFACLRDPNLATTAKAIFNGNRVNFGILNSQHVALFFSLGLIGCISYLPNALKAKHLLHKYGYSTVIISAAAVCTVGVLATQTRAAFLALIIAFAVAPVLLVIRRIRPKKTKLKIKALWSIVIVVMIGSIPIALRDNITNRDLSESGTLKAIVGGDWQNIPYTSIGVRANSWLEALEWIAEKPLIGYGAKVRTDVIQQSTRHPAWVKEKYAHLHNSYIEITLAFGLLGLILSVTPLVYCFKRCMTFDQPAHTFALFGLVVFIFMNLFESYLFFWMGPFLLTLIIAPIYSIELSKKITKGDKIQKLNT
jgi:O-antigen ligase